MANWKLPWWIWVPVSLGWAVLTVVAATFFSVGIQATFGVLAILSLFWGACATCWHFRDRWGCFLMALITGVSGALAVAGVCQIIQKVMAEAKTTTRVFSAEDLSPILVPETVDGDSVTVHLLVENKASLPVTIEHLEYSVPGILLGALLEDGPHTIPPQQKQEFPVVEDNRLMKVGRIEFRYKFMFNDGGQGWGYVKFLLPETIAPGAPIFPSECCHKEYPSDPVAFRLSEVERVLTLPEGGFATVVDERDDDGMFIRTIGSPPGKMLWVNPKTRTALLTSGPVGDQTVLYAVLPHNALNKHYIRAQWNRSLGVFEMAVDGVKAKRAEHVGRPTNAP